MDLFSVVNQFASASLKQISRDPGDYENEDGVLICHVCGEPKTVVKKMTLGADSTVNLWGRKCRCVREKEEDERTQEERKLREKRILRLHETSMMDGIYKNADFSQCVEDESNKNNLKLCHRYVDQFDVMLDRSQGLLFWGSSGTGKSFTAACIANALIEQEVPVLMTSFVRILDSCRTDPDYKDRFISRIAKKKLVIFDDLGAERSTDYALEQVYDIIDTRYRNRQPMIFTTNLTLDEMREQPDIRLARIYDRIFETCYPVHFKGKSWRMAGANKRWKEMKALLED